ncbi:MAG: N-acetylmuramoyl-L-alanine amidase [Nitrospirae bacterium]|nr:N-acetylmuramoyl-L-alanine amidase [Nitrospirota bacterium]
MKRLFIRLLILSVILFTYQNGICATPAYLNDIKNESTPSQSSVIINTSKKVDYKWAKLSGKVYIDLKSTELRDLNCKPITVDNGIIKLIRCAQYDLKTVRIVFELDKYKSCKIIRGENPNSLEIIFSTSSDITPKTQQTIVKNIQHDESNAGNVKEEPLIREKTPQSESENTSESVEQKTQKEIDPQIAQNIEHKIKQKYKRKKGKGHEKAEAFMPVKKIIVLDPGHGGNDPGAISSSGIQEKDLTLDISMRAARILKEKYNETVYLTRYNDVYIPLDKRTEIANNKNADVFVSIHINASSRTSLKGLETFLLSWSDDREALSVASRENQISITKMKQASSDLGIILSSLAREGKRDESLKLTHLIHSAMLAKVRGNYSSVQDLGVRKALFYVLVGASMPSALVEAGYITNPQEEKRLRSKTYREDIAESVARGIYKYVTTLGDAPTYARVVNTD